MAEGEEDEELRRLGQGVVVALVGCREEHGGGCHDERRRQAGRELDEHVVDDERPDEPRDVDRPEREQDDPHRVDRMVRVGREGEAGAVLQHVPDEEDVDEVEEGAVGEGRPVAPHASCGEQAGDEEEERHPELAERLHDRIEQPGIERHVGVHAHDGVAVDDEDDRQTLGKVRPNDARLGHAFLPAVRALIGTF